MDSDEFTCEAGTGVDYSRLSPVVQICGKPATLHPPRPKRGVFQVALCDEHAHLQDKGTT